MQNPVRRFIAPVAALLALSITLTACSGSTRTVTVTKTVTKTPLAQEAKTPLPPQPTCNPASTKPEKAGKEAYAYLTSTHRKQEFERIVPKAGIKIAQALQAGTFGKPNRYDSNKVALQPGETGWGGISSKGAFAWVYWKKDGSIDYTKPITQVSLGDIKHDKNVSIFGPDEPEPYWTVFMQVGKNTQGTPVGLDSKDPYLDPCGASYKGNSYPTTVGGTAALDTRALNQFLTSMNATFGSDWNK